MVRPVSQSERIPVSPKMIEAGLRAMKAWKNLPPGEVIAAVHRAMVRHDVEFVQVVSDILTPSAALLIIGGAVSKVFQGIRKLG